MFAIALPSSACSLIDCIDNGIEVRSDFAVTVQHDRKPLKGVLIRITSNGADGEVVRLSGMTESNGSLRVLKLPPGNYWMTATMSNIAAAYHCFHVKEHRSLRAKQRLRYEWGDDAPATQRVAGRIVDSQPGTGGNVIWNMVHRVEVPISGALLRLQNPISGEILTNVSGQDGAFMYDGVPDGTYVLHIEGGSSGRDYDPTDLLLKVSKTATGDRLELKRHEGGAGSCGGNELGLGIQ